MIATTLAKFEDLACCPELDPDSGCDVMDLWRLKFEPDHLELQNKLLARQIELLDKSQEYRCCPVDSVEVEN